jgi:hypothetical protein
VTSIAHMVSIDRSCVGGGMSVVPDPETLKQNLNIRALALEKREAPFAGACSLAGAYD